MRRLLNAFRFQASKRGSRKLCTLVSTSGDPSRIELISQRRGSWVARETEGPTDRARARAGRAVTEGDAGQQLDEEVNMRQVSVRV